MCIAEDRDNEEALRSASELIKTHYSAIAKLRREKDEELIRKLCEVVATGNVAQIRAFKEEVERR